ncbi:MAG: hypothetical protein ACE361_20190 [Aureliella sp.]
MKLGRFSLRTLLVLVTVVSAYFPLAGLFDDWISTTYDGYYVNSILASHIQNGDSIDEVASHFSAFRPIGDTDKIDMENVSRIWKSNRWTIEEEDQIYHFGTLGGSGTYLQFRGGRLINLNNKPYRDELGIAKQNGYPFPNWILRYGFFPLYISFTAVATLAFLLHKALRRNIASESAVAAPGDPFRKAENNNTINTKSPSSNEF